MIVDVSVVVDVSGAVVVIVDVSVVVDVSQEQLFDCGCLCCCDVSAGCCDLDVRC